MAKIWEGYRHGVNLGGWLSQCRHTKDRYETFITEEDIRRIASWGLDHIRVPVDYNLVEDEAGALREEGFGYIQRAVDWSRKYGLNMILDLHKTYGYSFDEGEKESGFFDNPAYQERFYRLWEQFAARFGAYQDTLAFELLNEVTDRAFSDRWNRIADTCVGRIRAVAPTIDILIGGYWNNSIDALPDLAMPRDAHIVYNFHCYDPLIFTHQGAPWVRNMDHAFRLPIGAPVGQLAEETEKLTGKKPLDFEGLDPAQPLTREYFDRRFSLAVRVAEERGVRLYCGEYGVIDLVSPEDTVGWYRMIHDAFERFGIGRAAWSYKEMDFGLTAAGLEAVLPELLQLL